MKKSFVSLLLVTILILGSILTGCGSNPNTDEPDNDTQTTPTAAPTAEPTAAPETTPTEAPAPTQEVPAEVTVTDSDGNEVTVKTNPAKVAIFDYSILDILYNIGFEKTGITQVIVPAKDNLPDALSFYSGAGDDTVISGGSLFYVDWDVMDLVQPDLVIVGGRAFNMNASGERLSREDAAKYRSDTVERYPGTGFIKLTTNSTDSQLLIDIEHNIQVLAQIFPVLKPELEAKLAELKAGIAEIHDKAANSGKKALFCMMVDQTTLSIFNPTSRFDMLYEEFGFAPADDSSAVEWTDQHGFDVRAEYVLEKNPDVIFLLDRSATVGTGAGAENFLNDPIIKQTQAAVNGDIYILSGDAWYTMTGGISATEVMISDIKQYIDKLQ